jgi:hypothetical protein
MSARRRGQRISRSDLIRDSRSALIQAGVGDHTRARFIRLVSEEVVGSRNPHYSQLQPRIVPHPRNRAWDLAYALIYQYLTEHNLSVTLETTTVETGAAAPASVRSDSTAEDQLSDLLDSAPPKVPVAERIVQAKRAAEAAKRKAAGQSGAKVEKPAGEKETPKKPSTPVKKKPLQKRPTGKQSEQSLKVVVSPPARKGQGDDSEASDFIIEDIRAPKSKRG